MINQRHDLTNRNCLISASTHAALPRSRLQAAWQHKRHRPTAVLPEQTLSAVPVQRTRRQELRKSSVLPGLASVAASAQPSQVIQGECPEHCLWAQRTRHFYRQPVVHLIGRVPAYLAERPLHFVRMLAGCNCDDVLGHLGLGLTLDATGSDALIANCRPVPRMAISSQRLWRAVT